MSQAARLRPDEIGDDLVRLKEAEANADARRIEAGGEADSQRKLADSDAYRLEVTEARGSARTMRQPRAGPSLKG